MWTDMGKEDEKCTKNINNTINNIIITEPNQYQYDSSHVK
jgi:hypothetical protein